MKKYKIGDKVWYAQRKAVEKTMQCPECFGQKALTVILGDGSQVSIECAGCMDGYEPPKGYVAYSEHITDVSEVIIDRVEETTVETEYGFNGCFRVKETELFVNKEDAEKRALELAQEYNREQIEKINRKEKHNRTWSWNAHYHRQRIRTAEKDLIYHKAKLEVAKVKTKEAKNTVAKSDGESL